jgi:hypothetical protein
MKLNPILALFLALAITLAGSLLLNGCVRGAYIDEFACKASSCEGTVSCHIGNSDNLSDCKETLREKMKVLCTGDYAITKMRLSNNWLYYVFTCPRREEH